MQIKDYVYIMLGIIIWFGAGMYFGTNIFNKDTVEKTQYSTNDYNYKCVINRCDVYLSQAIVEENKYEDLYKLITFAPEGTTIYLHLAPAVKINEIYILPEKACDLEVPGLDRGQDTITKCKDNMLYMNYSFNKVFSKYVKRIMTQSQVNRFWKGYDIYISGDEANNIINKGV